MKKLLLLCLVLVGYVGTVSARTIFFKPVGNWIQYESNYALYVWKEGNINRWYAFSSADDIEEFDGVYKVEIDDSYTGMKLCRMNPATSVDDYAFDGNCYDQSNNITVPSYSEAYYETYSDNWSDFDPKSSLLPWKYYFFSDKTDSFLADAENAMTESSGSYTYSFNNSDYAGKAFAWASGDAFNTNATVAHWDRVLRPTTVSDGRHWVRFATYIYSGEGKLLKNETGGLWLVPSPANEAGIVNEGKVNITYDGDLTATISCTKTATISSAGYITYSNGEKCTVSGATPYTISRENTNSTVHMKPWNSETVWPENEGMILKGTPEATVTIHSVESGAGVTDVGTNYLKGTGNTSISEDDFNGENIYILADGSQGLGFYRVKDDNKSLAAHKAYLDLGGGGSAREFLGFSFDDEVNGITEVRAVKGDGSIYNLQGVRMSQLQKGLNIVNGKKMLVK